MDVSPVEPSSTNSLSDKEELDRMEQILAIQAQIDELRGTPPRRSEAHPVEWNILVTVPQHQIPTIHTQKTSYLSQTIPSCPLPVPENNQRLHDWSQDLQNLWQDHQELSDTFIGSSETFTEPSPTLEQSVYNIYSASSAVANQSLCNATAPTRSLCSAISSPVPALQRSPICSPAVVHSLEDISSPATPLSTIPSSSSSILPPSSPMSSSLVSLSLTPFSTPSPSPSSSQVPISLGLDPITSMASLSQRSQGSGFDNYLDDPDWTSPPTNL